MRNSSKDLDIVAENAQERWRAVRDPLFWTIVKANLLSAALVWIVYIIYRILEHA